MGERGTVLSSDGLTQWAAHVQQRSHLPRGQRGVVRLRAHVAHQLLRLCDGAPPIAPSA